MKQEVLLSLAGLLLVEEMVWGSGCDALGCLIESVMLSL